MKIAMVIEGLPPVITGGAQNFCLELAKKLSEIGEDITILSSYGNTSYDEGYKENTTIKSEYIFNRVDNKYLRKIYFDFFNRSNEKRIAKFIKVNQPKIVHFHNIYGISSALINVASKYSKTILTAHDYWPICFNSTFLRKNKVCNFECFKCRFPFGFIGPKIHIRNLRKISRIVAPSKFLFNRFARFFNNLTQIYNAVEIPPLDNKAEKEVDILFAGRIVHHKGLHVLLEAVKGTDYKTWIIGDGPIKNDLMKYKVKYNINAEFLGGKTRSQVIDLYEKTRIFVIPSLWPENNPIAPIEAMLKGVPVVGSDIGGIPEVVENGITGLLFEPGNSTELKSLFKKILGNSELYSNLSLNGIHTAEKKFNWRNTLEGYLKVYEEVQKD